MTSVRHFNNNFIFLFLFSFREKGYLEQAAEAVGGEGFDVIIENASDINLGTDLTIIAAGARVVVNTIKVVFNSFQIHLN